MTASFPQPENQNAPQPAVLAALPESPDAGELRKRRYNVPFVALIAADGAAVLLGWAIAILVPWTSADGLEQQLALPLLAGLATFGLLNSADLYKSRVSSVRSAELAAITRTSATSMLLAVLIGYLLGGSGHLRISVTASVVVYLFLLIGRSMYDGWIRNARNEGRYCRPVVIVGTGKATEELQQLFADHQEAGYRVQGIIGPRPRSEDLRSGWLGPSQRALELMNAAGANGAFIMVDEIAPDERDTLLGELTAAGKHIHLSTGLTGVHHRRVRLAPVAHEPLIYVEPATLARWQLLCKRAMDLFIGSIALLIALPIILVAALAIKVTDRGPILFRQQRVGRDGEHFELLKLRTMAVDAEARLDELASQNDRSGPLFKVANDPRITRVGHMLRLTSIDELPQLFNVFRGDMSLVGPRPALPSEAAEFDTELQQRHQVPPGITGLWQVEARDNPSFRSYRRLDLFYVQNWSISLDLMILVLTAQSLVARVARALTGRSGNGEVLSSG